MSKQFLVLAFAAMLMSCGNRNASSNATASPSSPSPQEEAAAPSAADQLNKIYSDVFGWYDRAADDISLMDRQPNFDSLYLSSSYLALKQQVEKADSADVAEGMIGFFDSDHWICGQDVADPSYVIKSVEENDGKGSAKIQIKNCNTTTELKITLVLEKGNWKIDDFVLNGRSEKESMKRYVDGK